MVTTASRRAKRAPRRTMPRAAILSSTNRVSVIEAYASGNDVHGIMEMKINRTWLASHAGQFKLHTKHQPGDAYNPAAFSDQAGYDEAISDLQKQYDEKLKQ